MPPWVIGMKICSNVPGDKTKMAPRPIYGENLKNLHLRNQEAHYLETCYTASSTQVLPNLFKWWHWVDLAHFITWLNWFRNASARVKAYTAAYTAYSHMKYISKVILIQRILCVQVSDTGPHGPLVLYFWMWNKSCFKWKSMKMLMH